MVDSYVFRLLACAVTTSVLWCSTFMQYSKNNIVRSCEQWAFWIHINLLEMIDVTHRQETSASMDQDTVTRTRSHATYERKICWVRNKVFSIRTFEPIFLYLACSILPTKEKGAITCEPGALVGTSNIIYNRVPLQIRGVIRIAAVTMTDVV